MHLHHFAVMLTCFKHYVSHKVLRWQAVKPRSFSSSIWFNFNHPNLWYACHLPACQLPLIVLVDIHSIESCIHWKYLWLTDTVVLYIMKGAWHLVQFAGMWSTKGMNLGTKNRYDLQGGMVSSSPYANTYPVGQSVLLVCTGFQVPSNTGLSAPPPPLKWSHFV